MSLFSGGLWAEPKVRLKGTCSGAGEGGHQIYYETRGSPGGKPVLFVHGGPGRGIAHSTWSFFNRAYNIVLVDQRGCGRSTPLGLLSGNNTQALIDDFESIRQRLGIDKWMLFGLEAGSALALRYAQRHPQAVSAIILSNLLLFTPKEIDWLFKFGASEFFPDAWADFSGNVVSFGGSLLAAYYHALVQGNEDARRKAVAGWLTWERTISGMASPAQEAAFEEAYTTCKIACHFFVHGGFLQGDQLLDGMSVINEHEIPGVIVHGSGDHVTPIARAKELHRAWPQAEFICVPGCGHSVAEPGIQEALLKATADFGGCGCLLKVPRIFNRAP
jgi:proline iminopeptidase